MFDDAVLTAIRDHATEVWPEESCGVVTNGRYRPCTNIADDRCAGYRISGLEIALHRRLWPIQAIVHSHPDGWACPSALDMERQMQWGIPFGIVVSHESGSEAPVFWGGDVERPALIGRGFRHGITDCKALLDDWFLAERGVRLLDQPRDWEWWTTQNRNPDLYRAWFAEAGFRDVAESDLRPGDCILFAIRSSVPNHVGILQQDETILHHPSGRKPVDPTMLSGVDHYQRWRTWAVRWARYHG